MIAFFDLEVTNKKCNINDIGCILEDGKEFHAASIHNFLKFVKKTVYFCGHNIVEHDIFYFNKQSNKKINPKKGIDTLLLSALLYPKKQYHHLIKDDELSTTIFNDPLNDAKNAKRLYETECNVFNNLDPLVKDIFYKLLKNIDGFSAFFDVQKFFGRNNDLESNIKSYFSGLICDNANLTMLIKKHPVELAFCLALINAKEDNEETPSIFPSWIIHNYPKVEDIMFTLRSQPCEEGCDYCNSHLIAKDNLYSYFGYNEFRKFNGVPLQQKAVESALKNESLLAVFPTGGGKSLTYQLPALMSGRNARGLTVVISPLQSLMKDQVDNLESKHITSSATINGLLDPIEKAKAIERVQEGSVSILYISPESLRSRTIERLLLGRHVVRFVIDEAHCFSTWGQDFRVDYLYIGDFIKHIQETKKQDNPIPVSCFTATAKQQVIEDIMTYFNKKLGLNMQLFTTNSARENKIDFWKRELRYILDTEWDDILKEHKMFSVSMNAYETSKNFFGILYTPYEFIISDMGLVSERKFVPPQYVDKEGLGKVFELFEKKFDAKISKKDTFSKDIKTPFLDNYVILPISPNIAIISVSPFWKEEILPMFLLKMPFIRTGLKREYLLPPRNVYINQEKINKIKKNEVPNFEDIFSEEDQFIYKINVVSKDETILLNTLMMNESMKYVGFKSPHGVIDSFSRYAKQEMEDYCVTNKQRNYDGFPALLRSEINEGA